MGHIAHLMAVSNHEKMSKTIINYSSICKYIVDLMITIKSLKITYLLSPIVEGQDPSFYKVVLLEISNLFVFLGLLCYITFSWRRVVSCIWINLFPLHPRMLWNKIDWNWSRGSGEMWNATDTDKRVHCLLLASENHIYYSYMYECMLEYYTVESFLQYLWGQTFKDCQNFAGSWKCNLMDNLVCCITMQ